MKTSRRVFASLAAVLLLLGAAAAPKADDTDIYLLSGLPGGEPLVMFVLDYRDSLGATVCTGADAAGCKALADSVGESVPTTFLDLLRVALKAVFKPLINVRVGLMINHNNDNNCAGPTKTECSNGAYVLRGFKSFTQEDESDASKVEFLAKLKNLPPVAGSNKGHPFQGKELYFELFRYLTGQGIYNGHNGWTDYGSDVTQNLPDEYPPATLGINSISWDASIENGANYLSPLTEDCSKIYVINFMFQVSQNEDDSDAAIKAVKGAGGMAGIDLSGSKNSFDSAIRWMYDQDLADGTFGKAPALADKQNVTSYFLVDPTKINTTTNGYAQAGGTNRALPLSTNPKDLVDTLTSIFKEILSVSTTFVSASVPVNSFNRAEIVDNVYIALFQADTNPRWPGDLKKLKIQTDALGVTTLVDANLNDAVSNVDGRIKFDALTYWTVPGSLPAPDTTKNEVAGKDGRAVTRGGAGQKIPGMAGSGSASPGLANATGARQLFTEPDSHTNGTATDLLALNADSGTATALWADLNKGNQLSTSSTYSGATSADQAAALNLLKYARGLQPDGATLVQMFNRTWLLGDALHSRPFPINYGAHAGHTQSNPDIRILMGGNDGYMHMFNNTTAGGVEDGKELWAFMPRLAVGNLKRLSDNSPGAPIHPYGVDGPVAVYVNDANGNGTIDSGDKVYAYFGMRRGGKAYYALDITDPDAPKLLWTIQKTAGGDFDELGLTFSTPRVGKIKVDSTVKTVLVFAGGYFGGLNVGKDTRTSPRVIATGNNDSEGNALYVVDALTGDLVWKAAKGGLSASTTVYRHPDLDDSIPSDVAAVDTDGDGLFDRVYVGDTGGRVWRADLAGSDRTQWKITPVLSVGRHAGQPDRRFFHRPDVVQSRDSGGPFDAVIIPSGDRANPLATSVDNWLYMLKDRNVTSGNPPTTVKVQSDLADVTSDCLQQTSPCSVPPELANGWRMKLEKSGEKGLATPITIEGSIFLTSYVPPGAGASDAGTCGPAEGSGRLYAVSLQEGGAVVNFYTPNDASGTWVNGLGKEDRFTDLLSGGIPEQIVFMPPDEILRPDLKVEKISMTGAWRTFWQDVSR
jgi:type IV pilus assembly protein PilY1